MEFLIETLQRITPWYKNSDYEIPSTFPCGLPLEEVENLLAELPFQVSKEVYEIYQWCNGSYNVVNRKDPYFYNIDYMSRACVIPLREAIGFWFEANDEHEIISNSYNFPIFRHKRGLIVTVGSDCQQETSPVWDVDWVDDELRKPLFSNLTIMMTGIADTIEAEQGFWDDLGYFDEQGYWNVYKSIWKKYRL